MNPNRRPLWYAAVTFAALMLFMILYWVAATKKLVPGLNTPLREALRVAAATNDVTLTNPPVKNVRAIPVMANQPTPAPKQPAPTPPAATSQSAKPTPLNPSTTVDLVRLASEPQSNTNSVPGTTIDSSTVTQKFPSLPPVSKPTADDQRVARKWLANTNERPVIRVRYEADDVVRLATELGRALLVAGSGTTIRKEFFLEPSSKAPLFSPFSTVVTNLFANYSLALNPSPAFDHLTQVLSVYFAGQRYDLALVPDHAFATEIFAKVASATRSLPWEVPSAEGIVFEGQLRLSGTMPTFEILEARQGTNRHVFVSKSPPTSAGN